MSGIKNGTNNADEDVTEHCCGNGEMDIETKDVGQERNEQNATDTNAANQHPDEKAKSKKKADRNWFQIGAHNFLYDAYRGFEEYRQRDYSETKLSKYSGRVNLKT